MTQPGSPDATAISADEAAEVVLCELRAEPLSVDEVLALLADPRCGAQVLFLGRVRNHDHDRDVATLHYEAHPSAAAAMTAVCRSVALRFQVRRVVAVHRTGPLAIGDIAVVVGVAADHRGAAFAAGSALIDELKATVPIWKHQGFTDGDTEWVGLP